MTETPTDNLVTTSSDWAVASDGIQWILRHNGRPVSFVHSTKDVLARCMNEKGVHPETAGELLKGLPRTFNECPGVNRSRIEKVSS
jgi:hypothetical protein